MGHLSAPAVAATLEQHSMAEGSKCFDEVVTPAIVQTVMLCPMNRRQAWWDGFLASVVGAMAVSIGEDKTQDSCKDLYTRARDFASDQAKAAKTRGP